MKQLFFSLSVTILILIACNRTQNNSNDNDKQMPDSQKVTTQNKPNQDTDNLPNINYDIPTLIEFVKDKNTNLYKKLSDYVKFLNSGIKNFDDLKKALEQRDNLKKDLQKFLSENNELLANDWEEITAELNSIGYIAFYAEGMRLLVETSEILQNEINLYAPEEFLLYQNIKNKLSKNAGDMYLTNYLDFIVACEQLQNKSPNSDYWNLNEIKTTYKNYLNEITNLHYLLSDPETCIYGEFNTESEPPFTTLSDYNNMLSEKYSNTKVASILKKVLQNMSNFNSVDAPIYAVVIDKFDNYEQAENKKFEYLNDEKDIVHIIPTNDSKYYTCYRYYDNEKTAKTALDKIKSNFPEANIIKFSLIENEFRYVADNKTINIIKESSKN